MLPVFQFVANPPGSMITPLMFHSGGISLTKDWVKPSKAACTCQREVQAICCYRELTELGGIVERERGLRRVAADGRDVEHASSQSLQVDFTEEADGLYSARATGGKEC